MGEKVGISSHALHSLVTSWPSHLTPLPPLPPLPRMCDFDAHN
jgi:hypothetical protein